MSPELVVPDGDLETERRRLGMDTVGPTDHQRVAVCHSQAPGRVDQALQLLSDQRRRVAGLDRQARIDDVGAGQPEVDEPGCVADRLPGRPEERDHVMVGLVLDLPHPLQIATGAANGDDRPFGDPLPSVPRLADLLLDCQPGVQLVLVTPDRAHLRPRVPIDHSLPLVVDPVLPGRARDRRETRRRLSQLADSPSAAKS